MKGGKPRTYLQMPMILLMVSGNTRKILSFCPLRCCFVSLYACYFVCFFGFVLFCVSFFSFYLSFPCVEDYSRLLLRLYICFVRLFLLCTLYAFFLRLTRFPFSACPVGGGVRGASVGGPVGAPWTLPSGWDREVCPPGIY